MVFVAQVALFVVFRVFSIGFVALFILRVVFPSMEAVIAGQNWFVCIVPVPTTPGEVARVADSAEAISRAGFM